MVKKLKTKLKESTDIDNKNKMSENELKLMIEDLTHIINDNNSKHKLFISILSLFKNKNYTILEYNEIYDYLLIDTKLNPSKYLTEEENQKNKPELKTQLDSIINDSDSFNITNKGKKKIIELNLLKTKEYLDMIIHGEETEKVKDENIENDTNRDNKGNDNDNDNMLLMMNYNIENKVMKENDDGDNEENYEKEKGVNEGEGSNQDGENEQNGKKNAKKKKKKEKREKEINYEIKKEDKKKLIKNTYINKKKEKKIINNVKVQNKYKIVKSIEEDNQNEIINNNNTNNEINEKENKNEAQENNMDVEKEISNNNITPNEIVPDNIEDKSQDDFNNTEIFFNKLYNEFYNKKEKDIIELMPVKMKAGIEKLSKVKLDIKTIEDKMEMFNKKLIELNDDKNLYEEKKVLVDESQRELYDLYTIMLNELNSIKILIKINNYNKDIYNIHKIAMEKYKENYLKTIDKLKNNINDLKLIEILVINKKKEIKQYLNEINNLSKNIINNMNFQLLNQKEINFIKNEDKYDFINIDLVINNFIVKKNNIIKEMEKIDEIL